jgi:hypothetical protein
MKRIALFLLAAVMVAGMAGCDIGGNDGAKECISYYCGFFCDKVVDCGFLPAAERDGCISICEAKAFGKSEEQCQQTFSAAMGDSCDELAALVGLRSALDAPGKTGCFTR